MAARPQPIEALPRVQAAAAAAPAGVIAAFDAEAQRLSVALKGRLGFAARHLGTGETLGANAAEVFPMASTFKIAIAGATLAQVDRGALSLAQRVEVTGIHRQQTGDIADGVIHGIDRDSDGALSADETQAYVHRVSSALTLALDGRPIRLESIASTFPELDAIRRGEGTIRVRAHARLPRLSEGAHRLWFRNDRDREVSVYLANALVPESSRIAITGQRRDGAQSELTIDFEMRSAARASLPMWLLTAIVGVAGVGGLVVTSGKMSRRAT